MKGKFIAVEGPDGTGKETQQKLLISHLQEEGYEVESFDFPQYEISLFGKLVGEMLSESYGSMDNIHPRIASVIYAADRFKASVEINRCLSEGKIAIVNRYTLSNMAHQSARLPEEERDEFINWLEEMEYSSNGFGLPRPDLYIHLDLPTEISQELILNKAQRSYLDGKANRDALERSATHQIEAAKMYKHLSQTLPHIVTIDCMDYENKKILPKDNIHTRIWTKTEKIIKDDRIEGQINKER